MNTQLLAADDSPNCTISDALGEGALLLAQDSLRVFASQGDFLLKMQLAFGESFDIPAVEKLRSHWAERDFSLTPAVEIRTEAEMNGAWGAFAQNTNTIYLSGEFIAQNRDNPEAIARVYLAEFGHFVDRLINEEDSAEDEGAIFATLVEGGELDELELQRLKAEDDFALLSVGGQWVAVEQADGVLRWISSTSGFWHEASNWESGLAPGARTGNQDVVIDVDGEITTTHSTGNTAIAILSGCLYQKRMQRGLKL